MHGFSFLAAAAAIHQAWPWFWPLAAGVLGAVAGSFVNCARHRLPRGQSLRHPPSRCPSCQTTLGAPDLVPIASWLWLKGKCRHCGVPIGASSLWVEIALAALAAAAAHFFITS